MDLEEEGGGRCAQSRGQQQSVSRSPAPQPARELAVALEAQAPYRPRTGQRAEAEVAKKKINLTAIFKEMNSVLNCSPDELCHIEKGRMMGRVIGGATGGYSTKEKTDIIHVRSIMEQKEGRMEDLGMFDEIDENGEKIEASWQLLRGWTRRCLVCCW